jgi:hypothetical protein
MGKYGTNVTGLGAYEGGVNADNGATLVSTDSDGEKSQLFGPAALREQLAGVANGDFEVLPDNATGSISESNPLPYFTFTDNSSGRIVATIADSTLATGQTVLRFTLTSAVAADSVSFSRYVPITTSEARSYGNEPRVAFVSATSDTLYRLTFTSQYVTADFVATGTGGSVVQTGAQLATKIAASVAGAEWQAPVNGTGSVPADAAFLLLTLSVSATGSVASATLDISEIRIDKQQIQYLLSDQVAPDLWRAALYLYDGNLILSNGGVVGSESYLFIAAESGDITLDAKSQGKTISLTSASRTASTVTIVTTRTHEFATGYEVVVAGITGAAGTSMNGTFIVTVTDSTTFTYTAAGTAGSGTVTSATVKAGPGSGIIYLKPAATAAGKVRIEGRTDITGAANITGLTTMSGAAAVTGDVTVTGNLSASINMGTNNLFGSPALTGPAVGLGGTNNRTWVFSNSSGPADVLTSGSTTRAGVLITKAVNGQPTTNINGSGTTDAFADALRNGAIAVDTSNNRSYFYSSGWKYANLTTPSDSRLKQEITAITGALDTLRQLVPVAFKWKAPEAHGRTDAVADDGKRLGFIADQVATTDLAHWVETLGVDDREAHLVDTTEVLAVNIPQNEMEALVVQALLDIDTRLKALESR